MPSVGFDSRRPGAVPEDCSACHTSCIATLRNAWRFVNITTAFCRTELPGLLLPAGSACGGPQRPADVVEVADRLGVGAPQGGLAVRHTVLVAEGLDDGLGAAQVRPWHAREQMVFDLVVQ